MVRMSDIFKMAQNPPQQPAPNAPKEKAEEAPQVAKAVEERQLNTEKSQALYHQAVNFLNAFLQEADKLQPVPFKKIFDLVEALVNQIILSNTELLNLANNPRGYLEEKHINAHYVNVLILSAEVGLGLGYNKSRLDALCLAALLHDITIVKVVDLSRQPEPLTEAEYNSLKENAFYGIELLEKIRGLNNPAIYLKKSHREKLHHPEFITDLKDKRIKEYASLIELVDNYESMIHKRNKQKQHLPHEAIRDLLSITTRLFNPVMIKALINRIGIYPVGSWVELNTGEIGKVFELDRESPLRPVVNIVFDMHKKRLDSPRKVDLAKHYNIYIIKPLENQELKEKTQTS